MQEINTVMALAYVKVGYVYSNSALSKFKEEIKAILPILKEKNVQLYKTHFTG